MLTNEKFIQQESLAEFYNTRFVEKLNCARHFFKIRLRVVLLSSRFQVGADKGKTQMCLFWRNIFEKNIVTNIIPR